jgi:hypothetical protein
MLCQNLFNVESFFKCFQPSANSVNQDDGITLEIDKTRSYSHYAIDKRHTRISNLNQSLEFLNDISRFREIPPIFLTQNTRGREIDDVMHPLAIPFYKNIIISTMNEKQTIRLQIVLNGVHLLITSLPIFDKNNKLIAVTILETPFTNVQVS